jgi:hypothetical protein
VTIGCFFVCRTFDLQAMEQCQRLTVDMEEVGPLEEGSRISRSIFHKVLLHETELRVFAHTNDTHTTTIPLEINIFTTQMATDQLPSNDPSSSQNQGVLHRGKCAPHFFQLCLTSIHVEWSEFNACCFLEPSFLCISFLYPQGV